MLCLSPLPLTVPGGVCLDMLVLRPADSGPAVVLDIAADAPDLKAGVAFRLISLAATYHVRYNSRVFLRVEQT
jgi:hypothetical protein